MSESQEMSLKVGFSGSRYGMTDRQKAVFTVLIGALQPDEFHFGDCVGADFEGATIVHKLFKRGCEIHMHPPLNDSNRAFFKRSVKEYPKRAYTMRDRDIVDSVDILIATPKSSVRDFSGTWYSIRYGSKVLRPVFIIDPKTGKVWSYK